MAPWEANAYYDPSLNEMVLPIGELIPPILDLTASTGANYGSLGATRCAKRSEASLRLIVGSNEHPPEEFRVNGVLKNLPEFANSFACKAGSKMAPVERCSIW